MDKVYSRMVQESPNRAERRKDPSRCANVQPMLECFQSEVVEPIWWRSVSKNVRRPVWIGEDVELMVWMKARRPEFIWFRDVSEIVVVGAMICSTPQGHERSV